MDTEPEAKAKVVLKIYIRVLLYLNNNLNNNNINTFLTYLNGLVRQNKQRESEDDEFKSLDHIYIESIANKNLLKYDEAECKKTELEAESPGTNPPGPNPPDTKPPKPKPPAEAEAEAAKAAVAEAAVADAAVAEAAQAEAKAAQAETEAAQALAQAKAAQAEAEQALAAVAAAKVEAGEPQAGEAVAVAAEAGEAVAAEPQAKAAESAEVAKAKLTAAKKAVEVAEAKLAAAKAEAAAKVAAKAEAVAKAAAAAKTVAEVAAKAEAAAKAELTLNPEQIFTSFKQRLDTYNPPSDTKTYKYRDYGKTIDENYKNKGKTIIHIKRVEILIDTLNKFEANIRGYYNQAKQNMFVWCKNVKPRDPKGLEVIVKKMDWGEMALECTKIYNSIFACLNMANETYPGGGYNRGPAAQEENMFRRTDCHFSIDRERDLAVDRTYNKRMRELISAADGTTYIDVQAPRICIKGKENGDGTLSPENLLAIGPNLSNIGYDELIKEDIFLFYELRCAAVNINKDKGETFNPDEMKKRIEAQFKTLKNAGVRHAILGAFGCGAFNNPPDQVATLYKDCLERYKNDFDVIAFPIYYAGSGKNNYPEFRKILLNNPTDETTSIFYGAGAEAGAQAPVPNRTRKVSWRGMPKQPDTRRRR